MQSSRIYYKLAPIKAFSMSFLALLALLCFLMFIPLGIALLLRNRSAAWSKRLALIAIVLGMMQFTLWVFDAGGWQEAKHFKEVQSLLRDSTLRSLAQLGLSRTENMATLSALGEGLASRALRKPEEKAAIQVSIRRLIEMAHTDYFEPSKRNKGRWGVDWDYLAHLDILLGCYRRAGGDDQYAELHEAISTYLATDLVKSPYKNLYSDNNPIIIKPADNATVLFALALYDRCNGTDLSVRPIRDWSTYVLRELTFHYGKMPCATVTRENRCKDAPTSATIAPLTAALACADRDAARDVWREYKHYFKSTRLNLSATFAAVNPAISNLDPEQTLEPTAEEGRLATLMALRSAAYIGDRLTYYQLNNHLVLRDMREPEPRRWNRWKVMAMAQRFAAEAHTMQL